MTPKERLERAQANCAALVVVHWQIAALLEESRCEVRAAVLALLDAEDAERQAADQVQV